MKIGHIISVSLAYRLKKSLYPLIEALNQNGVSSVVIYINDTAEKVQLSPEGSFGKYTFEHDAKFLGGQVMDIVRVLKSEKVDCVHSHDMVSLTLAGLSAKLSGKKAIHTAHQPLDKKVSAIHWALHQKIVSTSAAIENELLQNAGIPVQKIVRIHDGIALEPSGRGTGEAQNLRQQLGIAENDFVVVNIGRLSREEDKDTLLKAFRKLIKKNTQAKLILLGDGPQRLSLEQLCHEYGIENDVKFLTAKIHPESVLKIADVFVTSAFEPSNPAVVLEAMAAGKPVIATKIDPFVEYILDGETGVLVPCGYPERIETALMRFYINRKLIGEFGDKAREVVEQQYSISSVAKRYQTLYEQLG